MEGLVSNGEPWYLFLILWRAVYLLKRKHFAIWSAREARGRRGSQSHAVVYESCVCGSLSSWHSVIVSVSLILGFAVGEPPRHRAST